MLPIVEKYSPVPLKWFLFNENARFNVAMIRNGRLDSGCSKDLQDAVTYAALRGRDQMDTSYVTECNSSKVADILLRMNYLVHTLVSEMYWKEYGQNKPGVFHHPISVCCGTFGTVIVVDYSLGVLFKEKLLEILVKDIDNPTCVTYDSGVIFVAEEKCISYFDIRHVVQLKPESL